MGDRHKTMKKIKRFSTTVAEGAAKKKKILNINTNYIRIVVKRRAVNFIHTYKYQSTVTASLQVNCVL